MSKEAWQEYIEGIRSRTNSLTPPYPTFPEFLRALLRLRSAAQVAKMVGVKEETIHVWTADSAKPNQQLNPKIAEVLGYRFGERVFYEAAASVNWTGDTPGEPGAIRSLEMLRAYLQQSRAQVRVTELARFFGFKTVSNLSDFTTGDQGLSGVSIVKILMKLPEIPRHVTGEVLSPITPLALVVTIAEDCRRRLGLGRPEFAKRLGLTHEYYNFFVGRTGDSGGDSGYMQNRDVYIAALAELTAIRTSLLSLDHPSDDGGAFDEGVPAPAAPAAQAEAPPGDRDELVRELFETHSEIHGIRRDQRALSERLDVALERLEALRQRFAPERPFVAEPVSAVEPVAAPAATEVVPPATLAEEPYLSPFTPERWRVHDLPVDSVLITMAKREIEGLCELLGLLAQMRDDESRAKVRAELDNHTTELLIALDAFSQAHPGTKIATLYTSWRRFQTALGVQGGETGNGTKEGG